MKFVVNKKIIQLFCIAGFFSIVGLFCVWAGRMQKDEATLTVGMMSGWPPFMSINEQGQFEGFDVDVAREVAQKLGKKLEIIDAGSLAPLFISLEQNRIDFILSGLDITQKRLSELAMVQYTGSNVDSLSLIFWQKIPDQVKKIEDLRSIENAVVCYEPGSSIDGFIKQFDFIQQKPLAQTSEMVMDIKYGKSLAGLLEPRVAARIARKNPEIKIVSVQLPPAYQLYGMGIALKKENRAFVERIEQIITQLKADGTLKALEQRWQLE